MGWFSKATGGVFGGFADSFTGKGMRNDQTRNQANIYGAYNTAKQDILGMQAPDLAQYIAQGDAATGQYNTMLQNAIQQSGLQRMFGPEYMANMQAMALQQGDVAAQSAARLAARAGAGRGGSAFGASQANQVRQAQLGAAMGTQGALLQARTQAEQGRAGVSGQVAQLLAGGAQNTLQAQQQARMGGLAAMLQFRLGQMGQLGDLGRALMGGYAQTSPMDTYRSFQNSMELLNTAANMFKAAQGAPGGGGGT